MPCSRIAVLTVGAALAWAIGADTASAQAGGVNDCTVLTDPTLLRLCVERARQGGNAGASPSSSQDAYSPSRTGARDGGEGRSPAASTSTAPKASSRSGKPGERDKPRPDSGAEPRRQGKIP